MPRKNGNSNKGGHAYRSTRLHDLRWHETGARDIENSPNRSFRGKIFGLARLLDIDSFKEVVSTLGPELKHFERGKAPALVQVHPNREESQLRNGDKARGQGKRGLIEAMRELPDLDQASAASPIDANVLGFMYRKMSRTGDTRVDLAVEDKPTEGYSQGYQLLGERAVLHSFAGMSDNLGLTALLRAEEEDRLPFLTLRIGFLVGNNVPGRRQSQIVTKPNLPETVLLAPISPIS